MIGMAVRKQDASQAREDPFPVLKLTVKCIAESCESQIALGDPVDQKAVLSVLNQDTGIANRRNFQQKDSSPANLSFNYTLLNM